MQIFIIVVISIITSLTGFLSITTKKIVDNRKVWYERPTISGWVIIVCLLLLICLPAIQFYYSNIEDEKTKIELSDANKTIITLQRKSLINQDNTILKTTQLLKDNIELKDAYAQLSKLQGKTVDLQNQLFNTHKELQYNTIQLQNPLPNQFLCNFNIALYNSELYNYALSLKQNGPFSAIFFLSPLITDTSSEYKKMNSYLADLLKDFEFKVWLKDKKTNKILLEGDNVINLNRIDFRNEYYETGTIDKLRPFVYLLLDENSKCFRLVFMNAKLNVLYKAKNIISIVDLEHSNLYMTIGYINCHNSELFVQDGLNKVEQVFNKIDIQYFHMDAGLSHQSAYSNLKNSLGSFIIKDFLWEDKRNINQ